MNQFSERHIGPRPSDLENMLNKIGVSNISELIDLAIPQAIRLSKENGLQALNESELLEHMKMLGKKNKNYRSYIASTIHTILPGVIQRNILENPGWYTAYTPYQAEIAQGRLEALLNYQTMVTDLQLCKLLMHHC